MNNNRHHIDDQFRQSFEQAKFKDADQHWEEVYDFLEGKKNRRKLFFGIKWPFLLLLLLGFTFGGLYWGFSNMNEDFQISPDVNAKNFTEEMPNKAISEPRASIEYPNSNKLSSNSILQDQRSYVKNEMSYHDNLPSGHFIKNDQKPSPDRLVSREDEPIEKTHISSKTNSSKTVKVLAVIPTMVINELAGYTDVQEIRLTTGQPVPIAKKVIIKSYKKWEKFQLMSFVASSKGQSATAFSGLRYGLGIERYIHPNIFVSGMISIVYQLNNNGFSSIINQSSYGLQKTDTYYGIQTRHLQYLHAPLLLGYKTGKHKIKAGGALNLYMSAFGSINEINPDQGSTINEIGRGWISAKYAKKYIPEWSFYYSYKFKRMTMGISMHYYTDSFYPTSSIISTNAQRPWAMGINVIYPVSKIF